MTFEEVLTSIAQTYGLDSYDLIGYSYEDEISGWDGGYGDWPVGSLWTVEGRVLYALVRALQPQVVVEIGTNVGCGASHIASALKMNGSGTLLSFDINSRIVIPPDATGTSAVYQQGQLIPAELLPLVELVHGDGIDYLRDCIGEVDFIFEDGSHGLEDTRDAWQFGLAKLNPGGWILSHDAAHFLVGETIQKGIAAAGVVPNVYEVRPSDCGLAIYRKPMGDIQPIAQYTTSKDIPLNAFVPNGDGEIVEFDYSFDKPKRQSKPDFDVMTDDELHDYADAHDIDLGRLRKRESIIERLQEG